jgi:hypothetical protein
MGFDVAILYHYQFSSWRFFVGAPNNETVFPQSMLIDYVRVYKQ